MEIWVQKTAAGLQPADEDARRAFDKHAVGSTFPIDIAMRITRSGAWHKRYWVLMQILGANLDHVEVEPGLVLPIRNKDDAHIAMKYATGLFDSFVVPGNVIRIVKSTAFESMTADEWADYWKRVLDAVHQKFLPGVTIASVENEIAMLAA